MPWTWTPAAKVAAEQGKDNSGKGGVAAGGRRRAAGATQATMDVDYQKLAAMVATMGKHGKIEQRLLAETAPWAVVSNGLWECECCGFER